MRKQLLVLLTTISILTCQHVARAEPPSSQSLGKRQKGIDWPRMLGKHYDSRSPETGIRTDWGSNGLPIVWTQRTGVGYGNGVVSDGRWFLFDRELSKERLICCEAETGKELWKWERPVVYTDPYGYNNGPRSSPVVDGDRIYVYGVAGRLACVSVVDGTSIWERDINTEYNVIQNFFGVAASPLVYDELLWVMVGGSPDSQKGMSTRDLALAKPNNCAMVAFDKRTGVEKFRVGNYLASYAAPVVSRIGPHDYCLALVREGLLTFQASDGTNLHFTPWRSRLFESVNGASPVILKNRILIGEAYEIGGQLIELSSQGHKSIWTDANRARLQHYRPHWTNPIVIDDTVYVSSGRNQPDTSLNCLRFENVDDGNTKSQLMWTQHNRNRLTSLLVDQHLLLLGENGVLQLVALNNKKYEVVAEMDLGSKEDPKDGTPYVLEPSWAPPVLSHGLLYIRGAHKVICLELIPE